MDESAKDALAIQANAVRRIYVLLAARLAAISFFMGVVVFYQFRYGMIPVSFQSLVPVGATYLLTIVYTAALPFVKRLARFIFFQLSVDSVLVTSIIYCTGGVDSMFSFMYILVIIASAILLWQSATYITASIASILYGLTLDMEYFGAIHPLYIFPPTYDQPNAAYFFFKALMNISVFFLVAYLSGYLTGMLRRTDEKLARKSEDFTLLQAFNENVLKNMASGFIAIDLDLSVLSENPAADRILGVGQDELRHKRIDAALRSPAIGAQLAHFIESDNDSLQLDFTYNKKDGSEINLTMTVSKFIVGDAAQGLIVVFQDMTNFKYMERQVANAERLAAIGRMAAGMAHEIRNPLASLSGAIQMLSSDLDSVLDKGGRRLMDITKREADRLNGIITQFLSYASPAKPKPGQIDLSNVIQETMILLESNPASKDKITFVSEIEPGISICADASQIKQVLWNLCVNAIDAMETGGTLTVALEKITAPAGSMREYARSVDQFRQATMAEYAKITVRDTGQGIDPANAGRIFEPFFTTKRGGTGLGLSMAHKIVESHEGKITVNSTPGAGTRVTIWLPVTPGFCAAA